MVRHLLNSIWDHRRELHCNMSECSPYVHSLSPYVQLPANKLNLFSISLKRNSQRFGSTLSKCFMHTFETTGTLQKHRCGWVIWALTALFNENSMRKIRLRVNLSFRKDTLAHCRSVWNNSPLFRAQFLIYQKTRTPFPDISTNYCGFATEQEDLHSLSYIGESFQQSIGYSVLCCMKTVALLPLGTFYPYSQEVSAVLNKMPYYGAAYIKAGKSMPLNKQIEVQN